MSQASIPSGKRPAKAITIVDIAREANVSIATVSRYLSGKGPVGEATREILEKLIHRYSYDHRNLSRGFRKRHTKTIGCLVQQLSQPYFVQSCAALEAACRQAGLSMFLSVSADDAEIEERAIQLFLEKEVDGLIMLGGSANYSQPPERFRAVMSVATEHCPVAFINGYYNGPLIRQIRTDEATGMRQLLDKVWDYGHRRIAFIGGQPDMGAAFIRFQVFREWVGERQIQIPEHWVHHTGYSVGAGGAAILEILAWKTLPSVVVCANDVLAAGAMKALHSRGFRVPDEISVVGFDGFELTDYPFPSLTTAAQDYVGLAREAVAALQVPDGAAISPLILPVHMVEGETLASCPPGSYSGTQPGR